MKKTIQTAPEAAQNLSILKHPFAFMRYVTKPYYVWAFGAVLGVTIGQTAGSSIPIVTGRLTDALLAAETTAEQLAVTKHWGLVFLAIMITLYTGWRLSGFFGVHWITKSNAYGYQNLYTYMTNHSHTYFSDRFAGSLSNKVSNAVDGTSRMTDRLLWGAYPQMVATIVNAFLLWLIHPYISLGFIAFVFVMIAINFLLVRKRRPHVVAFSNASSKLRGEGVDLLTNISATRQYVRFKHESQRLGDTILDRKAKDVRQWIMGEWILTLNNIAAFLLATAVVFAVYHLLERNLVSPGDAVLVFFVLFRVSHTFVTMGELMNGLIRLYGEVEEGLKEVLLPYEITDSAQARKLVVEESEVEWQNVAFTYGDNKVFDRFNLKIKPGERIGLVGPSGAGKTTFVSLMLRQHELGSGAICIDGQNIAEVTQDSLRAHIAVVPQEPILFHRTIKENIAYGKPRATLAEIEAVAKKAQAHDFISDLPDGYNTLVGERGIKLSGGQKQRVAIARAMLKDAPILVLDEATSALDSESEVAIQQALQKLMDGKTVVAIAHRLSTLREMDRIIVLESGKIVEDGTHDELTTAGGTYQRLWEHQAGGFLQD